MSGTFVNAAVEFDERLRGGNSGWRRVFLSYKFLMSIDFHAGLQGSFEGGTAAARVINVVGSVDCDRSCDF